MFVGPHFGSVVCIYDGITSKFVHFLTFRHQNNLHYTDNQQHNKTTLPAKS